MKKFSDITNKENFINFEADRSNELSDDVKSLDNEVADQVDSTKLDGEWEIQSIMSVSIDPPKEIETNEAIVINAELGSGPIKRGDFIYITALINKKGGYVHQNQMGVVKVRVVEIYNTLLVLNQLKRK